MTIENRQQTIRSKISLLIEQEKELIKEARDLLKSDEKEKNNSMFNTIYLKYREIQMKKEFCEYCLMYDFVVDGH